ncbi:MAG: hypothetical protein IKS15_01580 [Opitutales bacterium]|nr:hypothetical protein [Opitutales bacterium]
MELLLKILFCAAGAFYFFAGVSAFFAALKSRAVFRALFASGFLLHTAALVLICAHYSRAPFANPFELVESIAWAAAVLYMVFSLFLEMKIGGVLVSIAVGALAILPACCPKFVDEIPVGETLGAIAFLHAALAVAGFAVLAFAAALGGMYMLLCKMLKEKSRSAMSSGNPPLAKIARLGRGSLFCATAVMAASLVAGVFAALGVEMNAGFALKFCAGGFLFLAMLALCAFINKLSDLAGARLCVLLFGASLLLLIPIEIGVMQ